MKTTIISLLLFLGIATHAHADFYVIPVVTEKEVIKEVCTGISVGSRAFELDVPYLTYMSPREIYATTSGKLVEITGVTPCGLTKCQWYYTAAYEVEGSFLVAPNALPNPDYGAKGTFYYLYDGGIIFAKYL